MPLTLVLGDLHLGAEGCLEGEIKEVLENFAEKMDLILFNGDTIDTHDEKGKKALEQFLEWIDNKDWKTKIIFITGGMGHEGNILFDYPTIQILPWAILNTKEGRIIICHGHNIGLVKKYDETWMQTATRLKEQLVHKGIDFLPEIFPTDKIIISHTHIPFFAMDDGVFATGGWKVKDNMLDEYIKRNVGVFILIDDEDRNDPIKLKRFFLEKL